MFKATMYNIMLIIKLCDDLNFPSQYHVFDFDNIVNPIKLAMIINLLNNSIEITS